jgi:Mor family transcriptional regulator
MDDLTKLPDEFLPTIDELPGELASLARALESVVPGMGVRLALALESAFRGTSVYFHNVDNLRRKVRDKRIIERYNSGERVDDIARSVGMSSRHIWNILGREPGEDKQLKLF